MPRCRKAVSASVAAPHSGRSDKHPGRYRPNLPTSIHVTPGRPLRMARCNATVDSLDHAQGFDFHSCHSRQRGHALTKLLTLLLVNWLGSLRKKMIEAAVGAGRERISVSAPPH